MQQLTLMEECTSCNEEKPLSEFPLRKDSALGRRRTCLACRKKGRKKSLSREERERAETATKKKLFNIWDSAMRKRA